MARAVRRASSSDSAPVTRTVTNLVAPSPPRTMPIASGSHAALRLPTRTGQSLLGQLDAACAVGEDEHAVVGRALAVDGDRVERVVHRCLERTLQQRRRNRGVGRDYAEHRCHQRLDHARALGHAADTECSAAARASIAASFGNGSVVMIARAAAPPLSCESCAAASAMPRSTLSHRQLHADDAGRGDENRRCVAVDGLRRELGHQPRVVTAVSCRCRRWRSRY